MQLPAYIHANSPVQHEMASYRVKARRRKPAASVGKCPYATSWTWTGCKESDFTLSYALPECTRCATRDHPLLLPAFFLLSAGRARKGAAIRPHSRLCKPSLEISGVRLSPIQEPEHQVRDICLRRAPKSKSEFTLGRSDHSYRGNSKVLLALAIGAPKPDSQIGTRMSHDLDWWRTCKRCRPTTK